MDTHEYVNDKSARTDLPSYHVVSHRLQNDETVRLLHAAIGLTTEAGEVADALKKHIFYGKPIDKVNLAEECGDLLWYIAIVCRATGLSLSQMMDMNINKLAKRFPEKFDEVLADHRDLEVERNQLETDYVTE